MGARATAPTPDPEVRALRPDEADLIDEVVAHHLAAPTQWLPGYTVDPQAVVATRAMMVDQLASGAGTVLVVTEPGLAGFCWVFQSDGLPEAHVASLWAAPERRGRGIARRLKLAAEQWATDHGFATITGSVHRDNPAMHRLNESLGYQASPPESDATETSQWTAYRKALA